MNSRIAIFSLIVMVAAASALPGFNMLTDGFMTPISTPMGYLRSAVSNDDLQMCGTYDTGCMATDIMSMSSGLVMNGALNQDPTSMVMDLAMYIGGNCTDETAVTVFRCYYNLTLIPSNDIDRTFNLTSNHVDTKITALTMAGMNCTTPVEIGQWYNIMDLNCTDAQGKDPYEDMKKDMGGSAVGNFNRNATHLNLVEDGVAMPFLSVSTEGCSGTPAPTQPPTPGPTTQPPTPGPTQPPTQPPTPGPTTQPPTPGPTQPPTQPPTPGPTQPPTQPPTPGPTQPPTPTPTETPTKTPFNWMLIAIIGGGAAAVLILILLICCCKCKSGRNTNSRVRRVGKQNIESQPLKKNYI